MQHFAKIIAFKSANILCVNPTKGISGTSLFKTVLFTIYLVGGLEHLLFSHILGMSSSQLTNSYFSEG